MDHENNEVLEGVFAVAKPEHVSCADVLDKLQDSFAKSRAFAPHLEQLPKRPGKSDEQPFKMGHGGTLDPLAAGVLIVGIGRGTKALQQYLACSKTYETIIIFGSSTDTYDCTGLVTEQVNYEHITKELVEEKLAQFKGTILQTPPLYSALKINGVKACEYARRGEALPRELEPREMQVTECLLLDWYDSGKHNFSCAGRRDASSPNRAPAVRIRLTVCSGFYVRSFAHDLGTACLSRSHMAALLRTRQATFTNDQSSVSLGLVPAITYADLEAGEDVWGPKISLQLTTWAHANPLPEGHTNGRDQSTKNKLAADRESRPRQRFRGDWVAETKKDRIKQQGGKFKGKWSRKISSDTEKPEVTMKAHHQV